MRYSLKQILVSNHIRLEAVIDDRTHSHSPHSKEPIRELGRVRACPIPHMKQRERDRKRQSKVTMLILFIFPDQPNTNSHSKGAVCVYVYCEKQFLALLSHNPQAALTCPVPASQSASQSGNSSNQSSAHASEQLIPPTRRRREGTWVRDLEIYRNMDM